MTGKVTPCTFIGLTNSRNRGNPVYRNSPPGTEETGRQTKNKAMNYIHEKTAEERLNDILRLIRSGRTLIFSTYTSHIAVSPKTLKKWEARGLDLFKARGNSVLMASGKKYVCTNGCKITIH